MAINEYEAYQITHLDSIFEVRRLLSPGECPNKANALVAEKLAAHMRTTNLAIFSDSDAAYAYVLGGRSILRNIPRPVMEQLISQQSVFPVQVWDRGPAPKTVLVGELSTGYKEYEVSIFWHRTRSLRYPDNAVIHGDGAVAIVNFEETLNLHSDFIEDGGPGIDAFNNALAHSMQHDGIYLVAEYDEGERTNRYAARTVIGGGKELPITQEQFDLVTGLNSVTRRVLLFPNGVPQYVYTLKYSEIANWWACSIYTDSGKTPKPVGYDAKIDGNSLQFGNY